jgi:hypothetical protein
VRQNIIVEGAYSRGGCLPHCNQEEGEGERERERERERKDLLFKGMPPVIYSS